MSGQTVIEEKKTKRKATEIKDPEHKSFDQLLKEFEDSFDPTNLDWLEDFTYKGFDRKKVVEDAYSKVRNVTTLQKIGVVVNLRGPVAASNMIIDGFALKQLPKSAPGKQIATLNGLGASLIDYTAAILKIKGANKRIKDHPLPACLQFPAAGALPLNTELRKLHMDFSEKFSKLIRGEFNTDIYKAMVENAYCSVKCYDVLKEYLDVSFRPK